MNYKIEGAIRRNKKNFIIFLILWIILTIVFVSPFSYSIFKANESGIFNLEAFINTFSSSITKPFNTIVNIFSEGATGNFGSIMVGFTIVYAIFFFIGLLKSTPKNEFSDIEHGSSDWSQRGEQYQILSKNKGIILAENNYLPIDKRGNVNVLVVGRFRFW